MTKLMDMGEIFVEGKNIDEIMEKLNNGDGDWSYYYRPDCSMVDAYFCEEEGFCKLDFNGDYADAMYDVIED